MLLQILYTKKEYISHIFDFTKDYSGKNVYYIRIQFDKKLYTTKQMISD